MKNITVLLLLIISFMFIGCTSKPISTTLEPTTKKVADITFSLQFIPEQELIDLHKKQGNVFANYPGRIPPKKIIVFELDISTEESIVDFNINDISLSIGAVTGASKSQYQLLRAWQSYNKDIVAAGKAKKMVRLRMFEDEVTVTPEQPVSAWIVFLENYPDFGEANLSINLIANGSDSGTVNIPLNFTLITGKEKMISDPEKEEKEEKTSIFDE